MFATLGTCATGDTTADLLILCGLGLLGLLMREGGIPVATVVVGLLLGTWWGNNCAAHSPLGGRPVDPRAEPGHGALPAAVAIALVASFAVPAIRRSQANTP